MANRIKEFLKKALGFNAYMRWQRIETEKSKLLNGKLFAEINKTKTDSNRLEDYEFSVFSQLGDDGIIQYLIYKIPKLPKRFIEFGVQTYEESNTRFLLMNNNWSGLIMDGSSEFINFIKKDYYYWKYNIKACNEFITSENINYILEREGFNKEIGILHIDIDGNDYWIWKSITTVDPEIVILEYNSCFGNERSISTPYKPDFERYNFHSSGIVFGASLPALIELAHEKGYYFAGSNSYGNNAYFLKTKYQDIIPEVNQLEGYRFSFCRQNKNSFGDFTFELDADAIKKIKSVKVFNTKTKQLENLN